MSELNVLAMNMNFQLCLASGTLKSAGKIVINIA